MLTPVLGTQQVLTKGSSRGFNSRNPWTELCGCGSCLLGHSWLLYDSVLLMINAKFIQQRFVECLLHPRSHQRSGDGATNNIDKPLAFVNLHLINYKDCTMLQQNE
jgi:hypothetical protein